MVVPRRTQVLIVSPSFESAVLNPSDSCFSKRLSPVVMKSTLTLRSAFGGGGGFLLFSLESLPSQISVFDASVLKPLYRMYSVSSCLVLYI